LISITTTESTELRSLLFRVGEKLYGCPIGSVREIVPFRGAVRLPGAPPYVHGLVNLRGTIVTVLDLGGWMIGGAPVVTTGSVIVVEHGGRVAGVAVHEVRHVTDLSPEPMNDADPERAAVIRGLGRIDDTVVILLDIHALIRLVLD
jgi:purine-binding chemotaxis protein CheW